MAKLLSDHAEAPRRYLIQSYFSRRVKVLDSADGVSYTIQVDSAEEATIMLNWSDAEWHAWLAEQGDRV